MQALASHLESVMAEAEIAANAQRDLEAEEGNPLASAPRQEATEEQAEEEGSDEAEDSEPVDATQEEPEGEEEEAEEEEGEPPAAPTTPEEPKYSRRGALRALEQTRTELEQAKRELESTRGQLDSHRGEVAAVRAADARIRTHMQKQSGYVREDNGRFRYENLSERVLRGTATPEEQDEVATMTQWHEFAGPIFRAAEEQVLQAFMADWNKLADLPGVGTDGLTKLNQASTTADGARTLHALAFAAGEAKAKKELESQVAKLRAENKSLKTSKVAAAPQPASSNGAAVPAKGGLITRMLDPKTGLVNPDFDREVAQGKWLGVDLANQ